MATLANNSRGRRRASRSATAGPSLREVCLIEVGTAPPADAGAPFRWLGRTYRIGATEPQKEGRRYLHLVGADDAA